MHQKTNISLDKITIFGLISSQKHVHQNSITIFNIGSSSLRKSNVQEKKHQRKLNQCPRQTFACGQVKLPHQD